MLTDFEPVALLANTPLVIAAKKAMPANDLKELIAWLKANPGNATQGSVGVGSQGHLAGILFQRATGTRFQHVPYRGAGPATQDLIAGQIDLLFGDPSIVPAVRAGSVKAIALAAKHRLPAVPDIPTAEESGLPGFAFANWVGIFAPKGTPKDIVGKLNGAVMSTVAEPSIRARLIDLGVEIPSREQQTPDGFAAMQKAGTVDDVAKVRAALLSSTHSGMWTIKYDQRGEQVFDFDIAHLKKGGVIQITHVEP